MRVILDVNRPSSLSCCVQNCSSVEGFLDLQSKYPEDEYVIDPESFEAYETYMKRLTDSKLEKLLDELHIDKADYDVMMDYYANVSPKVFEVWEEQIIHEEMLEDEYYAELLADYEETLRDARPNCFD